MVEHFRYNGKYESIAFLILSHSQYIFLLLLRLLIFWLIQRNSFAASSSRAFVLCDEILKTFRNSSERKFVDGTDYCAVIIFNKSIGYINSIRYFWQVYLPSIVCFWVKIKASHYSSKSYPTIQKIPVAKEFRFEVSIPSDLRLENTKIDSLVLLILPFEMIYYKRRGVPWINMNI